MLTSLQAAIMEIFCHLQYSVFGSILTIGAVIGAITSGRVADWLGRKGVGTEADTLLLS